MAKVKIQGHASGTGILTVTAPNTSTDRTITLPDSTGSLIADDGSGKVGIGTSSPARLLSLYGDTGIALQNSTTGTGTGNGTHIWVNSAGSGELLIQNRENSDIEFLTNDTERMRILAGGGITFNGDTAAANALDDYEEGTWTPQVAGISSYGTYTYTEQQGQYVKIGNQVTAWINLTNVTTSSAGVGGAIILGLPFTCNWQAGFNGQGVGVLAISFWNNINGAYINPIVIDGDNYIQIYAHTGVTNNYDAVPITDKTSNSADIRGFVTYYTGG